MTEKTQHISEKKKQIAENIQRLILNYPIIAAVNMENLPAPQLQQMRFQLRDKIVITMTKRRIMKHAIEEIKDKKKNIEQLEPCLKGMPALIFTKENPFSLFRTLKKSKTSAPAKAGQIAPFDLKIPKGPTSFAPGPVIGELAQLGIKSGVEGGKVVIKEDSIVVKEGQKISAKAAEILTRLGIEPMEVGLNVTAVYENGKIFTKEILDIDEDKFKADLQKAASGAFNLAVNSAYPTKETVKVLIGKAFNDAKALGLSLEIIDEGIIEALLSKAESSALSLKSTAKIKTVEKPKVEEKKEEVKVEEPKIEEKKAEEVKVKEVPAPAMEKEIKEEPTPEEKKEEKVLEEEKEIIKEEEKLEKEIKESKIEAPVEKEIEKEVKEEEEKQLEKERVEKEKELKKIEEQKKAEKEAKRKSEEEEKRKLEEEKRRKEIKIEEKRPEEVPKVEEKPEDDTDKKIAEMVAKTKKFVKGEIPDAEKLIEEAGKLVTKEIKEKPKEEPKVEVKPKVAHIKVVPKEEPQETVPRIQELKERKEESAKEKKKKKKEQEEVESLAQELVRKGTLRR